MQTRFKSPIIICSFCGEEVLRRHLAKHYQDDCHKLPDIPTGNDICTTCQIVKPVSDFPRSKYRPNGYTLKCKACGLAHYHEWRKDSIISGHLDKSKNRTVTAKKRPGRWVLKPCDWCGEPFRQYDMILHRPRCPKRPPRKDGKKQCFVPSYRVEPGTIESHAESMERLQRNVRNGNLKKYGMFQHDFERMLAEQKGLCAICGLPPDSNHPVKHKRVLAVDHDHATNKVRGLLCYNCNHGIGNFMDDPMNLAKAILYLRRFQEFDLWEVIHFLESEAMFNY